MLYASLLMPDSVSPSGAAFDGEKLYFVNGIAPWVYVFSYDGVYIDRFRTFRPYSSIRFSDGRFCCISSPYENKIYIANRNLEEICTVPLEAQDDSDMREITDLFFDTNGFCVSHRRSLRVYAPDGSFERTVTRNPIGRQFLKWTDFASHRALYFTEKNRKYLYVDSSGGTVPDGVSLKAFIPYGNDLYGAFSYGYIYTYVVPILTNGIINHSVYGNFAFIADNISRGCCK